MRAVCGVTVMLVALSVPAWAQSGTGVSVSLVGDIVRQNGSTVEPYIDRGVKRDGEGLGFSLRVDRALGSRWGVELEYVRGTELESTGSTLIPELTTSVTNSAGESISSRLLLPYFPREVRSTYRQRLSTVSTLGWFRQSVGDRTSLIYSAGIAFGVTQSESQTDYGNLPNQLSIPAFSQKYTSYSVLPIVGFEARLKMSERASLVPGIRVIGADNAIIIRPNVGLRWEF